MKKIRISMVALVALIMAVGGTAFAFKATPKKGDIIFWQLICLKYFVFN